MVNKLLIGVGLVALFAVGSFGVWQAISGDGDRRAAALGPIDEPVALSWRGEWAEDAKYSAGQVVSYRGSSYVAEAENANTLPNAKEGPWALMAAHGLQGPQGTFNGTFRSPNGNYSLVVADTGITLQGPPGTIRLNGSGVNLTINNNVSVNAGQSLNLESSGPGVVKAGASLTVEAGGTLQLKGAIINQN